MGLLLMLCEVGECCCDECYYFCLLCGVCDVCV